MHSEQQALVQQLQTAVDAADKHAVLPRVRQIISRADYFRAQIISVCRSFPCANSFAPLYLFLLGI
jgi:hypothetical protein